jgi:hypothetical protein
MTPELQKYYEDRFRMMQTQGWKDLMDDIQVMLETTNNLEGIDDLRKLGIKQGEVSMMNWMLSLKECSEETYEELQREES